MMVVTDIFSSGHVRDFLAKTTGYHASRCVFVFFYAKIAYNLTALDKGDLGVQRGLVRWFLSLHSPKHAYTISPRKLPSAQADSKDANGGNGGGDDNPGITLPDLGVPPRASTPDAASFPPAPISSPPVTPVKGRKRPNNGNAMNADNVEDPEVPMPPPAFTPSINRTLNKVLPTKYHPSPLPEGLSVKELQSRLEGKKKIKYVDLDLHGVFCRC